MILGKLLYLNQLKQQEMDLMMSRDPFQVRLFSDFISLDKIQPYLLEE